MTKMNEYDLTEFKGYFEKDKMNTYKRYTFNIIVGSGIVWNRISPVVPVWQQQLQAQFLQTPPWHPLLPVAPAWAV